MANMGLSYGQELGACLQQYFVTSIRSSQGPVLANSAEDLLDATRLTPILRQQSDQLGQPDPVVIGTLFAKRYSVFAMGLLAAISLHDTSLALSHDRVRLQVTQAGAMQYETAVEDSPLLSVSNLEERRARLTDYVVRLQMHLQPIFQAVSAQTGANVQVMWTLVSHNLHNLYARLEADERIWQTTERLRLIMADRSVLLEPRSGHAFAVKFRLFEHSQWQGSPFYLRRHCCLAYRIQHPSGEHDYCQTCPKLSTEERLQMLVK
ncbi:hypothetical protein LOZ80_37305 [Paenibacillus sp. HWE-109]|uniref:hypothetical protein n=1 Tax=Paenibacillus sp. HWE-109 TaxID=1306526 RepID=UPI001EDE269B|nr:hypothetical protein [Paenibacillus sp. HWE-109]UKS27056.1 hypothetical protein LOZ80_37305 [Paenibacillus sp. HWE-109]